MAFFVILTTLPTYLLTYLLISQPWHMFWNLFYVWVIKCLFIEFHSHIKCLCYLFILRREYSKLWLWRKTTISAMCLSCTLGSEFPVPSSQLPDFGTLLTVFHDLDLAACSRPSITSHVNRENAMTLRHHASWSSWMRDNNGHVVVV